MNWDYIAGFFDGEGCVWIQRSSTTGRKRRHPTVSIAQSQPGFLALCAIEDFLKKQGIDSKIYEAKYKDSKHRGHYYALRVHRRDSVCKFLSNIFERCLVKRLVISKALSWMALHPNRNWLIAHPGQKTFSKIAAHAHE